MSASKFSIATIVLSVLFSVAQTASANEVANVGRQYRHADIVKKIVSSLQSKIVSNELKATLLENVRPEDAAFAKSVVVRWKAYNDKNLAAEFDQLVVIDDRGLEKVRMQALPKDGEFNINGRIWKAPTSGSIEKSLRRHLDGDKSATRDRSLDAKSSIFASILSPSEAFAQIDNAREILPLYLFARANGGSETAAAALYSNKPKLSSGYAAIDAVQNYFGSSFTVRCQNETAVGQARIAGEILNFESKIDGTLKLTFDDKDKTKLLVTSEVLGHAKLASRQLAKLERFRQSQPPDEQLARSILNELKSHLSESSTSPSELLANGMKKNMTDKEAVILLNVIRNYVEDYYRSINRSTVRRTMTVTKCDSPECLRSGSEPQHRNILPWIAAKRSLPEVTRALKWHDRNGKGKSSISLIEDGSGFYELNNASDLKTDDSIEAKSLLKKANLAVLELKKATENEMRSLRPLGACCADAECRKTMASDGIQFETKSKTGKTGP